MPIKHVSPHLLKKISLPCREAAGISDVLAPDTLMRKASPGLIREGRRLAWKASA
jgi:hypothetical protein